MEQSVDMNASVEIDKSGEVDEGDKMVPPASLEDSKEETSITFHPAKKLDTNPDPHVPPLPKDDFTPTGHMSRFEYALLSSFLGIADTLSDLELSYALYFVSAQILGCDYYTDFGNLFLVHAVVGIFYNPIAGAIADKYDPVLTNVISICIATALTPLVYRGFLPYWALIFVFQFRGQSINQTLYCIWKLVKVRAELVYGNDVLLQSHCVARIGTLADWVTEAHETITLAIAYALAKTGYSFHAVMFAVYANVFLANVITLGISIWIWKKDFIKHDKSIKKAKEPASPTPTTLGYSQGSEEVEVDIARERAKPKRRIRGHVIKKLASLKEVASYYKIRWTTLWHNKIAYHAVSHSFLVYALWTIVSYPFALQIAATADTDDDPTLDNLCANDFVNLVEQFFFTMLMYSGMSFLYMWTLVKCPAIWYYRYVLPGLCGIIALFVALLWWDGIKNQSVISALVAFCVVIPYYLNSYDYYLATGAVTRHHYGFLDAYYGDINAIIALIPGLLIALPIFGAIYLLCIITLIVIALTLAHGFYFVIKYHSKLKFEDEKENK